MRGAWLQARRGAEVTASQGNGGEHAEGVSTVGMGTALVRGPACCLGLRDRVVEAAPGESILARTRAGLAAASRSLSMGRPFTDQLEQRRCLPKPADVSEPARQRQAGLERAGRQEAPPRRPAGWPHGTARQAFLHSALDPTGSRPGPVLPWDPALPGRDRPGGPSCTTPARRRAELSPMPALAWEQGDQCPVLRTPRRGRYRGSASARPQPARASRASRSPGRCRTL